MGCRKLIDNGKLKIENGKQLFKYNFDAIGNRTKYRHNRDVVQLAYNSANQIATEKYLYDEFGNLIATPDAQYYYNLNNRLSKVITKKYVLKFKYDANGRRVEKVVIDAKTGRPVKTIRFLYSGFKCVASQETNGEVKFYQWTPRSGIYNGTSSQQLLGIHNPKTAQTLNVLTDGNKNVIGLINNQGAILNKYSYTPFGKELRKLETVENATPFKISSEYHDQETNLTYYNFRYYNPKLGRWLTKDPIKEQGGVNLYGMVGNGIINLWDKLGLENGAYRQYMINQAKEITVQIVEVVENSEKGKQIAKIAVTSTLNDILKGSVPVLRGLSPLNSIFLCLISCIFTIKSSFIAETEPRNLR